jgi:hypothetical protein
MSALSGIDVQPDGTAFGGALNRSPGVYLRIRITRRGHGDLDGVALTGFEVGSTYEVSSTVGTYLIAIGNAEPVEVTTSPSFSSLRRKNRARRQSVVAADRPTAPASDDTPDDSA